MHGHTGLDLNTPLGEGTLNHLGDIFIEAGQDFRRVFQNGHLGPEVAHHGCELGSNGAAANHDRRVRQTGDGEQFIGGHDLTFVDGKPVERAWHRACGEHNPISGDVYLTGGPTADSDGPMVTAQNACAVIQGNLAALKEAG